MLTALAPMHTRPVSFGRGRLNRCAGWRGGSNATGAACGGFRLLSAVLGAARWHPHASGLVGPSLWSNRAVRAAWLAGQRGRAHRALLPAAPSMGVRQRCIAVTARGVSSLLAIALAAAAVVMPVNSQSRRLEQPPLLRCDAQHPAAALWQRCIDAQPMNVVGCIPAAGVKAGNRVGQPVVGGAPDLASLYRAHIDISSGTREPMYSYRHHFPATPW